MTDTPRFGIRDADGYWMGDTDGPITYDDERLAQVARAILWERFEHHKYFEVAPFTSASMRHDELTPRISGHEALRRAEGERADTETPK